MDQHDKNRKTTKISDLDTKSIANENKPYVEGDSLNISPCEDTGTDQPNADTAMEIDEIVSNLITDANPAELNNELLDDVEPMETDTQEGVPVDAKTLLNNETIEGSQTVEDQNFEGQSLETSNLAISKDIITETDCLSNKTDQKIVSISPNKSANINDKNEDCKIAEVTSDDEKMSSLERGVESMEVDSSNKELEFDEPVLIETVEKLSKNLAEDEDQDITITEDTKDTTSNQEAPDNTEFVTTENDEKNENEIDNNDDDPIGAESENKLEIENEKVVSENDESILPDTDGNKEDIENKEENKIEDNEQYFVTKIFGQDQQKCMQCDKSDVPKYSCKVGERELFLCNEDCLKTLREKKPLQVIVRDLRVKTFAVIEPLVLNQIPKITGNNVCGTCSKDIEKNIGFNWNVMNFCTLKCLETYQNRLASICIECQGTVPQNVMGKYSVRFGENIKQFCKNFCLLEHKRKQRFCYLCQSPVEEINKSGFCSLMCLNVSKGFKRKGVCAVCKARKPLEILYRNLDFCGDPCFVAYKFVNNVNPKLCEFCKEGSDSEFSNNIWLFDRKVNLCSKDCRRVFIATTRKIIHCKTCNVKKYEYDMIQTFKEGAKNSYCSLNCLSAIIVKCDLCLKVTKPMYHLKTVDNIEHHFCSMECMKLFKNRLGSSNVVEKKYERKQNTIEPATTKVINGEDIVRKVKKIVVIKPRPIPAQRNVATMCKPNMVSKATICKPRESTKSCQTDTYKNKYLIPIPVPIYVPTPLGMYSLPVPCPFPIPIPIPVPIFIPTRRNSINGILKEISKIKNKVPANPLEAELLMMAEMVAEDKKEESNSDSEDDQKPATVAEPMETTNFGEDVIQMALKMATDDSAEDEGTASTSSPADESTQRIESIMELKRRSIRQGKQRRKTETDEKLDANMCLKYTFGVNAWKQWVTTKNLELQKASKKPKLFKQEILHLTSDELNFSLCLFVKEVRKPNGSEYAPDTIYYLCLGVQQYLYENGRIDNIFCDPFFEKFTDALNEVCQKFSLLYNESQYIVTRVEEEHLWESKQLGAHSPLVLLNTLMFFNTKHFSLTTVDEHLQLSFSHIMKHWKRNPNQPGSRNVLLRFYPPQTADGPRKKKVYEQQENDSNPIRCPVKLYEFYLSKCPESVKTRNDVFYLQPERSCVPDSPVWYSTMAMDKEPLEKMLNRVKMVKEINIAILTT